MLRILDVVVEGAGLCCGSLVIDTRLDATRHAGHRSRALTFRSSFGSDAIPNPYFVSSDNYFHQPRSFLILSEDSFYQWQYSCYDEFIYYSGCVHIAQEVWALLQLPATLLLA